MKVITGTARRKNIKTLEGLDIRPTASSVKEAMFSAIQFEIEGHVVLDLFAGSGQLGIEALSRGAKKAYFVDSNTKAINVIKENLETTELSEKSSVFHTTNGAFLRTINETFDIAILDPPYERNLIPKSLTLLVNKMAENSVIICEHEINCKLPETAGNFSIHKSYKYGKIGMTIYRNKNSEE